jgi:hypothetical protein
MHTYPKCTNPLFSITLLQIKWLDWHQSLISLVMIDPEFGRENHSSIPCSGDRKGAETTWC